MGIVHAGGPWAKDKVHITAAAGPLAVGRFQAQTTATTAIAGGGASTTVTPVSMTNINQNDWLEIFGGTGTSERVQVTAIQYSSGAPVSFSAVFANAHSGTYNITTRHKVFIGRVVINKVGTTDTITLYDGHPSWTIQPGQAFAVITPTAGGNYVYDAECLFGLYYTVGGTAGDYTITFLDSPATT